MNVFPYIFSYQAPPVAARYFTENAAKDDKLFNYKYGQFELFFYSYPQAIKLNSSENLKSVAGKKGNLIFTDESGFKEIADLKLNADTVIVYKHLYLNRGGQFVNPKSRGEFLYPMYLIRY